MPRITARVEFHVAGPGFWRVPLLALLALAASVCVTRSATATSIPALDVYPAPEGSALNTDFAVNVRTPGGAWREVPTYRVKVSIVEGAQHVFQDASMAFFDFAGTVEVAVVHRRAAVTSARIRPRALGLVPRVEGDSLTFTLTQPRNLSIEVNGDIAHNLHLFAGRIADAPDRADPNVVFYGPGVHTLPPGGLRVKSGQTIHFAGGAVVRGHIRCANVANVRIAGRGYFDQPRNPITVTDSKNVVIDGLMVTRSINIAQSEGVTIRDLKTISHGGWGDGIDVYCSRDVSIEDVFLRTSDDCIAIYAHRNRWSGDVKNVTVLRATLWADVAHPILVGTHGNTPNPETIENLVFRDIDILDHCEAQLDYQGCLSLNASDSNLIRNVRFENIRIDDFRRGQLVNLRVMWNRKYCTSPGRGIEDVVFKDIAYEGARALPSIIAGYDETRRIRNVVFENLTINGVVISDDMAKPNWHRTSDYAHFYVGEHVEGLSFRKAAPAPTPALSPSP